MRVISRLALLSIVSISALATISTVHAAESVDCSTLSAEITTPVMIGLDDLLVPIPAPYDAQGMCLKADFDGDGVDELLVQGYTSSDETVIFKQGVDGKYSSIHQRWDNTYLGLDWAANNSTLYAEKYDGDNKDDLILSSDVGDEDAILYSSASDSTFATVSYRWQEEPEPQTVNVAGSTPGEFNVDKGAATYSIPVEVPPGIAGMEPTVSLNYNSMAGNGLVGVGWSIGGLSVITRCPRSLAIDNHKRGVQFDSSDAYCLDGQRLVEVASNSGQEYRTDIESYSRITTPNANGNPSYFKVETKAGLTMYFGYHADNDTRIEKQGSDSTVLHWPISRIEDKNGNYLHFTYDEDNETGEYYPKEIKYTGHGSQLPSRSVAFSYNLIRPDPIKRYVGGSKVAVKRTLKSIETFVQTELVQKLSLHYKTTQSQATGRTRLESVQKCATKGAVEECMAPVTFEWQDPGVVDFPVNEEHKNDSVGNFLGVLGYPDVNGDGYADICSKHRNPLELVDISGDPFTGYEYYVRCRLSTATEFGGGAIIPTNMIYASQRGSYVDYIYIVDPDAPAAFGDVDGDMRQEIFVKTLNGVQVWRFNGAGFEQVSSDEQRTGLCGSGTPDCNDSDNHRTIQFPDINGDGRVDICYRSDGGVRCYLTNDNGFALGDLIDTTVCRNGVSCDHPTIQFVDVNADGLTDFFYRSSGGVRAYAYNEETKGFSLWQNTDMADGSSDGDGVCSNTDCNEDNQYTIQAPDINGDGLPELCYRHDQDGVKCYLNNGEAWEVLSPIDTGICYNLQPECNDHDNRPTITYADFNNDGMQDIVYRGDGGIRIYTSIGDGFELALDSGHCRNDATGVGVYCNHSHFDKISYQDVSGDGKVDMAMVASRYTLIMKR